MNAKATNKGNKDGYRAVIVSRKEHKRPPAVDKRGQIVIPPCAHCFYLQEEVHRLKVKLQHTGIPNSVGISPTPNAKPLDRVPKGNDTWSTWQNQWANTPDVMTTRRTGDSPRLNPGKEMGKEAEQMTMEINRLKRELIAREAEVRMLRDNNQVISASKKDPWGGISNNRGGTIKDDSIPLWKVAEIYSALYDTEWQDAFKSLTQSGSQEEEAINVLQNILMQSYAYCKEKSDLQLDGITNGSVLSAQNQRHNRTPVQTIAGQQQSSDFKNDAISYRIRIADKTIPHIQETFIKEKLETSLRSKVNILDNAIKKYVDKCVIVTWYMCIQDPKMVLENNITQFSTFDKNFYRYYSTQGERFNYVVWPVLKTQNGGKVSAMGVAEAASERVLRNANIISARKT